MADLLIIAFRLCCGTLGSCVVRTALVAATSTLGLGSMLLEHGILIDPSGVAGLAPAATDLLHSAHWLASTISVAVFWPGR